VVHDAAGGVLSRASNKVEAFNLAGVLRIGGVTSEAEVNATLGAPRKLRSNLAVSDVTVAGQTVGVTDKGLVVAGTTVPLPADDRLAQVLRDQDVTVAYVKSERTADAITSAGLRVTTRRAVPGLPEPVQMSYLFGRAHASATAGRDTGDSTAVAPAPPLQPPASGARTGASAPLGSSAAGAAADAPPVAAPTVAAAGTTLSSPALRRTGALRVDGAWYLVLILGGVVMTVCACLLRLFGVRGLWA
jgi:hypothetical protein